MSLLHEERLDGAVAAGEAGIGELLDVRTKMGNSLAYGEVMSSTPFGVVLRQEDGADHFYAEQYHLFFAVTPDLEVVDGNMLSDSSPDARVRAKLSAMGEAGDPQPGGGGHAKTLDKAGGPDSDDTAPGEDDSENGDDKPPEKPPEPTGDKPLAKPESAVDVEALPQDIKDAVISTNQMDKEQLNSVLSELSDAAMKGLKRVGVAETEIFGTVQRIQNSAYRVLTGQPPPPPKGTKPGKKKKK
jgi:hypothetical protein